MKKSEYMSSEFAWSEHEGFLRAESYCDGYCMGFWNGHSSSLPSEDCSEDENEDYKTGYRRGFAVGGARSRQEESGRKAREPLYEEVEEMHQDYIRQGQQFTDMQWGRWKNLQSQVKEIGNRSWEDLLLEVYRSLHSYGDGARLTADELSAIRTVKEGIIKRFAKAVAER